MKNITIICPVYNEEENIKIFVATFSQIFEKYKDLSFSILFADNNSTDKSYDLIKAICKNNDKIKYIRYSKNYGVMKSIYAALAHIDSDACCVFDCDLQDPAILLDEFITHWKDGYEIIYGKRVKRIESFHLSVLRIFFKKISFWVRGFNIEIESGAWFFDKNVVSEIKNCDFEPYLPVLINGLDFKKKSVPYERNDRKFGNSKFNIFKYLSYAADGLVSGTTRPLRISIFISFIFALFSFVSSVYFILAKFFLSVVFAEGVAAIIIINLISFSLIFFFLAILAEYVGKIYLSEENKKHAIIKKKINL